jgi:acetyltransferase
VKGLQPLQRAVLHVPPHEFEAPRGRYLVRAARAGDEPGLRRMLEESAPDDVRLRFFRHVRLFPHAFIEPLTRMDDSRNFAFVAVKQTFEAPVVGSAMMALDRAGTTAEFGIFVDRAEAGQRLGSHLLDCLIREARGHGVQTLFGVILSENATMIDLARRLGFSIDTDLEEHGCMRATLRLDAPPPAAAGAATAH